MEAASSASALIPLSFCRVPVRLNTAWLAPAFYFNLACPSSSYHRPCRPLFCGMHGTAHHVSCAPSSPARLEAPACAKLGLSVGLREVGSARFARSFQTVTRRVWQRKLQVPRRFSPPHGPHFAHMRPFPDALGASEIEGSGCCGSCRPANDDYGGQTSSDWFPSGCRQGPAHLGSRRGEWSVPESFPRVMPSCVAERSARSPAVIPDTGGCRGSVYVAVRRSGRGACN